MNTERTHGLSQKRVLLTRSPERAEAFSEILHERGAVVECQGITEMRMPDKKGRRALADSLLDRDWDWLVFTSAAAVTACCEVLDEFSSSVDALGDVKIAAVGPATARSLVECGLTVSLVAKKQDGLGLAEAMCAQGLGKAHRVLFPRAKSGRTELVLALEKAGAKVTVVEAYCTMSSSQSPGLTSTCQRLREGHFDVVGFFAPSQVETLCALIGVEVLRSVPVLVAIGQTTAACLKQLGLHAHGVARTPTPWAFANAIANAFLLPQRTE